MFNANSIISKKSFFIFLTIAFILTSISLVNTNYENGFNIYFLIEPYYLVPIILLVIINLISSFINFKNKKTKNILSILINLLTSLYYIYIGFATLAIAFMDW